MGCTPRSLHFGPYCCSPSNIDIMFQAFSVPLTRPSRPLLEKWALGRKEEQGGVWSNSNIIPMPGRNLSLGAPALDALGQFLSWEPPLLPMCTGSAYGGSVSGWRGGRLWNTAVDAGGPLVVPTLLSQPWALLPVRTIMAKGYATPDLRPLP